MNSNYIKLPKERRRNIGGKSSLMNSVLCLAILELTHLFIVSLQEIKIPSLEPVKIGGAPIIGRMLSISFEVSQDILVSTREMTVSNPT